MSEGRGTFSKKYLFPLTKNHSTPPQNLLRRPEQVFEIQHSNRTRQHHGNGDPVRDFQNHHAAEGRNQHHADDEPGNIPADRYGGTAVEEADDEHDHITQTGGNGRTHGTHNGNQQNIADDVAYGTDEDRHEGCHTPLVHQIGGGQEIGQTAEGRCQNQHGNKPPRFIIFRCRQNHCGKLGRHDQPGRTAESHSLIYPRHIGEQPLSFLLRLIRKGGKLPGIGEYVGNNNQNRGDLVGDGVDPVGGFAQNGCNDKTVGDVDDPAADGGGNQGQTVFQHIEICLLLQTAAENRTQIKGPPLLVLQNTERRTGAVRQNTGQHISRHTHVQYGQKQDVQRDRHSGAENPVFRIQPYIAAGPGELTAGRMEVGRDDVEAYQNRVAARVGDQIQQGIGQQQYRRPDGRGENPEGVHRFAVRRLVHAETDYRIGDPGGGNGDQQIGQLYHIVHDTVFRCIEHGRVKGCQEKYQQLGPKGTQRNEQGVG